MLIDDLMAEGMQIYNQIEAGDNSGDRSWEHCHGVFAAYRDKDLTDEAVDYLCLHLAWYLASWGMLRNSFLRLYDYKIHKDVVKLMYEDTWYDLWDVDMMTLKEPSVAKHLMDLAEEIIDIYKPYCRDEKIPTDTLLTKILLGTMGCVPAYDRYFVEAMGLTGMTCKRLCTKSLMALGRFYGDNQAAFEAMVVACSGRVPYPSAKVMDMCFFGLGYASATAKAQSSSAT